MLIDIHCHLDHKFPDIEEVIERARKSGVSIINTNGIDPKTNRIALKLAARFDIVKASLGIYPPDALRNEVGEELEGFSIDEEIKFIEKNKEKIIAIGEVGMDFQTGTEKQEQKELFFKMIALAEKTNKPIIVHSRKAYLECVEMLESSRAKKVVMHCFMGNFGLVKRIADNLWYFSVPTSIVRSEHFQKLVKEVDLSRLFTETDAPYLSPFADTRNEPAFVEESIKKIAQIKGMDKIEVENNIYLNYGRLFL
ncbi:MAG: TatD family hydrolase [Candidatus Woesearchaeota archaeon]